VRHEEAVPRFDDGSRSIRGDVSTAGGESQISAHDVQFGCDHHFDSGWQMRGVLI
jgi:hypothetical protein